MLNLFQKLFCKNKIIKIKEKCGITGRIKLITQDIITGEIEESDWIHNFITDIGRTAIARRLGNIALKTNEGMITYAGVGIGADAPSVLSTKLSSEFIRKNVSDANIIDAYTIELRLYLSLSEGNAGLTNFGLFGEDASAVTDSGTLFEIVAINKVKTNAKTLLIVIQLTII